MCAKGCFEWLSNRASIEDLLLATLDAVSRFRVGQREAVSAALDAGALLTNCTAWAWRRARRPCG